MSYSALSDHFNTYVMGLRPLEIVLHLQCGDRHFRRQILTTKVYPRTVRVNIPENRPNFLTTRRFRMEISMELVYNIYLFSLNFTHFKSSSSITSRGLRQQFAACSG